MGGGKKRKKVKGGERGYKDLPVSAEVDMMTGMSKTVPREAWAIMLCL